MSWLYRRGWRLALPPRSATLPLGGVVIATGFVLCWSSGFVGSRLAVAIDTPPLALYAWRFALATALAALWWLLRALGEGSGRISARELRGELASGSLTVGLYLLAMLVGIQQGVSAGVASLIGALQPLAAATLAALWLNERSSRVQWLGMLVATLGAGLCVLDDARGVGGAPIWAYGLPVLAVASVTLGSVMTARPDRGLPLEARLTLQLAAATGVFFAAALLLGEDGIAPPAISRESLLVMAWLVVLATFGGYGFFVQGLSRFGVTRLSTLIYLTPAVTLVWTALLFDELPGLLGGLGMIVAALGVLLTFGDPGKQGSGASVRAPRHEPAAPGTQASRAKIKSQTPWPSRSPRASNLVEGRNSGRGT
ncbi:Permease of the drug/metabolite transporter (DMT) superfamily [Modicisalibacter ilicicola DSM 19980]|uniref:Permease of the drug/metabolite transporter (DMT) superfamily n=1 Tax=Modicisalibacter ilicicola DSM 19980 TaxID=1121942 RepID=A0A1M5AF77_9GAMM|nr:DMT family transporter [Halomonas ilicicola]SHF28797.1 Permease of the drug/metabolite transporter (DMT) superfamily [Halomonas ilicicola DSM 19980]